ncbi:MAG: hypothetical protein QM722_03120 [Piscinibacter sp.]
MYRCLLALLAALWLAGPAAAQVQRHFPATALRGSIELRQAPEAILNGKEARLSAGARIFGQDNLLKMPASLIGQKMAVHYTVDGQGFVREVWILTETELAKRPWPASAAEAKAWHFDPVRQVWAKP